MHCSVRPTGLVRFVAILLLPAASLWSPRLLAQTTKEKPRAAAAPTPRVGEVSTDDYLAHIKYLADDELEGRGIGTEGIAQAGDYIAEQFKRCGLEPAGDDGTFFQEFDLDLWKRIGPKTSLTSRKEGDEKVTLELGRDWTPMTLSLAETFEGSLVFAGYGISDEEKDYDDYKGIDVDKKVVLLIRYEPTFMLDDATKPEEHSRHAQLRVKARGALDRGAAAVLIVNPVHVIAEDALQEFGHGAQGNLGIPLYQIARAAADRLLASAGLEPVATLEKRIESDRRPVSAEAPHVQLSGTADLLSDGPRVRNVLGLRRGEGPHADEIILIGGHFDHLGKSPTMRNPNGPAQIHNGADDNASGSAGVIECARIVSAGPPPQRTMLFMTFSAEESGLLGSKHFADHPTVPIDRIVTMLNMDMIGRMKENVIQIGGQRTGEGLADLVERRVHDYGFEVKDGGGGRGPSDHTSFYAKKIPVLFFFTGLHRQYHMPEDDIDLINAKDGARVAQLVADLAYDIAALPERLKYTPDATPIAMLGAGDRGPRNSIRTTGGSRVTLGILPGMDDRPGILADEVLSDSPAAKANLKAGDRITRVAGADISDIGSLQVALDKIKPGDTVDLVAQRGGQAVELHVAFPAPQFAGRDGDHPRRPFREDGLGRGRRGRDGEDSSDGTGRGRSESAGDNATARKPDEKEKPAANPHGDMGDSAPAMPRVRLGIAPSYGGSDGKRGYAIEYVVPGGAAAKAGMKDSDRILTVGGKVISDVYSYMESLQSFKPGDSIKLVVLRDGKEVELTVKAAGEGNRGAS